jgi:hypothetical protein
MIDGPYGPGWYGRGGANYENARTVLRRAYGRERYRHHPPYRSYRYAPNRYYGNSYYPRRGYGWPVERPRAGRVNRAIEQDRR